MPTETAPKPTLESLAVLSLPATLDSLDAARASGRACVWGGERLTIETAVDLGEQTDSAGRVCFLRACRRHAGQAAHRALMEHAPSCEQCTDNAGGCGLGRVLLRLIREGRR
ncbi:hypothetical protein ACIO13_24775 [Streptomyces sp. NPDC087425]|uniref:hypothetical protein n=1 Tax=Streptomyces sp. NPDC087425 TaxID=3365787 RepID=UPI00382189BF